MIKVHLRSGKVIEVSNPYSSVEKFIMDDTGQAIVLMDSEDEGCKHLVRKEAIDHIQNCEKE